MVHVDITQTGIDPMAEMSFEEYEAARDKYLDIVQEMLPEWASCSWDDCYLTLTSFDHDDSELREIANKAWEKFCEA